MINQTSPQTERTMSNVAETAAEHASDWITIDTDALTDQSLYPFCFQLDALNLDHQLAIEMGLEIPAGSPSGLSNVGELSMRTIHSQNKNPTEVSFPTVTAEHPIVETTSEEHPGKDFLDRSDDVTALTVTTDRASPRPVDLSTPSNTSAASLFGATNAGAVGSALKTLPMECTQNIYGQLLIVPLGEWTPSRHTPSDQTERQDPVSMYGVGITIFVAHEKTSNAVPTLRSKVRGNATAVSEMFTAVGSTPEFQRVWRHSTRAEELIRRPTLKPDPTRYRWVTQRGKLGPAIQAIRNYSSMVSSVPNTVLPHLPHAREVVGTPAKIRVQKKDLAWLLGPRPADDHART